MNAVPFLVLLFFTTTCHGEMQDNPHVTGILSRTKPQMKSEMSMAVSCPDSSDIEPCECYIYQGYLIMHCSNVEDEEQLRKVFSASFPTTTFYTFEMYGNTGVKVLEDGVFGDVSFVEFIITKSVLETVRNDALKTSLSTLEDIYINLCELAIFPFERLQDFTSLRTLSLFSNKIHSLPPLSSASIHIFDLSYNPISYLTTDIFSLLTAVEFFYLGGCSLTEITPGTFSSLPKLDLLDLSENKISYLQSNTFDFISTSMGLLMLSNNTIDSIEVDVFKGMREEATIEIDNNYLTSLKEEVWRPVLEKNISVYLQGQSETMMSSYYSTSAMFGDEFYTFRKRVNLWRHDSIGGVLKVQRPILFHGSIS